MIDRTQTLPGWSRGRFWSVAGILFVFQAALIFLFAARSHPAAAAHAMPGYFGIIGETNGADAVARNFFASDPTVFALPGIHGFSGLAWLGDTGQALAPTNDSEGPEWLAMKTAGLGTNFPALISARPLLPFQLRDEDKPELDPWPAMLPPEEALPGSRFEILGDLGARRISPPTALKSWPSGPNGSVLANTIVQIAVNSAGQVVAARLLDRSGSPDADAQALATAGTWRFRPSPEGSAVWGRAVFNWQTAMKTNSNTTAQ